MPLTSNNVLRDFISNNETLLNVGNNILIKGNTSTHLDKQSAQSPNDDPLTLGAVSKISSGDGTTFYQMWLSSLNDPDADLRIEAHEFGHIYFGHLDDYYEGLDANLRKLLETRGDEIAERINENCGVEFGKALVQQVVSNKDLNHSLHNLAMDLQVNSTILTRDDILLLERAYFKHVVGCLPEEYAERKQATINEKKASGEIKTDEEESVFSLTYDLSFEEKNTPVTRAARSKFVHPSFFTDYRTGKPFPNKLTYPAYLNLIVENLAEFVKLQISINLGGNASDSGSISMDQVREMLGNSIADQIQNFLDSTRFSDGGEASSEGEGGDDQDDDNQQGQSSGGNSNKTKDKQQGQGKGKDQDQDGNGEKDKSSSNPKDGDKKDEHSSNKSLEYDDPKSQEQDERVKKQSQMRGKNKGRQGEEEDGDEDNDNNSGEESENNTKSQRHHSSNLGIRNIHDHKSPERQQADDRRQENDYAVKDRAPGRGNSSEFFIRDVNQEDPVETALSDVFEDFKRRFITLVSKRDILKHKRRGTFKSCERMDKMLYPSNSTRYDYKYEEKIVFLIDVSYSMDSRLVDRCINSISLKMMEITGGRKMKYDLITWNTALVEHREDLNPDSKIEEIEVGGGTCMAAGIQYFIDNCGEGSTLVLISDFEDNLAEWARASERAKPGQVLWGFNYGSSGNFNRDHVGRMQVRNFHQDNY